MLLAALLVFIVIIISITYEHEKTMFKSSFRKIRLTLSWVMSSNVRNNALFIEQLSFEAWLIILILFTSVENEQ